MRYSRLSLKRQLDYARYNHLAMMFLIALLFFLISELPHKWWILSTVVIVSAAIEPGLMMQRANARIRGTLLALLLMIPLLYVLQLNYRFIPLTLILAFCFIGAAAMNPNRYDISVFFITIAIFLLTAQTTGAHTLEGPVEMVINRGLCTLIGITIIIIGDYFLFNSYQYAQKLHLFNQLNVYSCLQKNVRLLRTKPLKEISSYHFLNTMRDHFNDAYTKVSFSATSLSEDLKANAYIDQQVEQFQNTIWELRKVIFALTSAIIVLHDEHIIEHHLAEYRRLMAQARHQFIDRI